MVPLRFVFRSRWAALAWAAGICWTAMSFVGDQHAGGVDAANSTDTPAAAVNALAAEEAGD